MLIVQWCLTLRYAAAGMVTLEIPSLDVMSQVGCLSLIRNIQIYKSLFIINIFIFDFNNLLKFSSIFDFSRIVSSFRIINLCNL